MSSETGTDLSPDSGERYERGSRIAAGGMGEVWRARDRVLGREVAVKILKREFADDPTFRARFEAEARHAAGLHHPNIASVFDYGLLQGDETPYLVMELVDGKPLSDLLASGDPVDPEQARLLALQVADALAVAHAAGVVHRDVKPGNLLVTPDGRVKITDFGIARATGSVAFTQTGQIVGTPHYLAPEQARGASATAASDVYSLGVVLFECLAGSRPFDADTPIATALAQIQQEAPPLPDTVPPALAAVVERALLKDPEERYADGHALAAALRGAAPGAAPATAAVGVPAEDRTRVLGAGMAPVAGGAAAAAVATPATDSFAGPSDGVVPVAAETDARSRSRKALWIAGALALLLLVALLALRPWEGSEDPDPDTSSQTDSVRVRKSAYVGDPVADVEDRLQAKELRTSTDTVENDGTHEPGTVADLSPTGLVEQGETITLEVWGAAPAEEQAPPTDPATPEESEKSEEKDDKDDKGQDDKGNGNEGNQGNDGEGKQDEEPTEPEKTEGSGGDAPPESAPDGETEGGTSAGVDGGTQAAPDGPGRGRPTDKPTRRG